MVLREEEDTDFISLRQRAKLLSHSTTLSTNDLQPYGGGR